MNQIVKILLLVVLVATSVSCNKAEQPNSLQKVLDDGVLRVGTNYGLTTYYHGATGPVGFEYELAAGFADFLNVRLEVFPYYTLNELFPQLENGHLDLIASGITVTPERTELFRFGPAYQDVSQKLVFKQGNERPRNPAQLTGNLTIIAGSSHAETLRLAATGS